MSAEPPAKKLRLSSPDEPLTQRDVVAFQKEALYRCMNEKRTKLGAVQQQYDVSRRNYVDVSTKLSNIMALIITLANYLRDISRMRESAADEQLCAQMATSDEDEVIQLSDAFMRILTKYVGSTGATDIVPPDSGALALELKELHRAKKELAYRNKELQDEIAALKGYYEKLVRSYDREDSQTVARVFKKEIEGSSADKHEESDAKETATREEDTAVPAVATAPTVETAPAETDTLAHRKLVAEYEIKATELQNEVKELKVVVAELQKFKKQNEDTIVALERQLSPSSKANVDSDPGHDTDALRSKVDILAKENASLKQVNDAYLGKFQELASEREVFNNKISSEFNTGLEALREQNAVLSKDLVRIRTARDDLLSKLSILEAETKVPVILQDLQRALELSDQQWEKVERRTASNSEDALLKEIQDMETAFKELSKINAKKYPELLNQESVISKLKIEKTKADQKYFAAMRSKDSILIENKNLTKTLAKSNEMLLQLKDSEKLLQQKIENLYQQLKLSQNNEKRLTDSAKSESLKIIDLNSQINRSDKKITYLKSENLSLITDVNKLKTRNQELETEAKALAQKNTNLNEKCDKIHEKLISFTGKPEEKKGHYSSSDDQEGLVQELENFRTLVYCSLCSKNWKNMAIKTCGHVFCEDCCNERLAARMRKCPTCNYPFSSNDLLPIHL
ncbi:E3 ubiquitin-protein ligase [Maudiozyma humilis]|uniref:E3 ubiquitin protein ligase n=1 Tax=Maudiozyma humilis TaxID=51915 RepID=A0AAV5RR97_MAUHU|nr:E3 ubiquitin-protein ligase [Kazachstania humilis]